MLAAGWLDEVRTLVSSEVRDELRDDARDRRVKCSRHCPRPKPFQFIGYSDLRAHLEGRIPLAAAVANIQQSTRRFAKRQLTWFRREPDVHWLASFGDADETIAAALLIATEQADFRGKEAILRVCSLRGCRLCLQGRISKKPRPAKIES